jgi:hypothetical protein
MTVGELIEQLKGVPNDLDIFVDRDGRIGSKSPVLLVRDLNMCEVLGHDDEMRHLPVFGVAFRLKRVAVLVELK